jgi:hypothetical protein
MAFNLDQWNEVTRLTSALREMGCAVCVFVPDDIESAVAEQSESDGVDYGCTDVEALELLATNRKYIESAMSESGNVVIADFVGEKFKWG